ncbi:hypothetical protein EON68_04955, partial [archaeon]
MSGDRQYQHAMRARPARCRDIKPENCLLRLPVKPVYTTGMLNSTVAASGGAGGAAAAEIEEALLAAGNGSGYLLKLADFGLAREIKSKAPCTDYVSTRWY